MDTYTSQVYRDHVINGLDHGVCVSKLERRIQEARIKAERSLQELRRAECQLESFLSETSRIHEGQKRSPSKSSCEIRTIPTVAEITEMVRQINLSKTRAIVEEETKMQNECQQYYLHGHR